MSGPPPPPRAVDATRSARWTIRILAGLCALHLAFAVLQLVGWPLWVAADPSGLPWLTLGRGLFMGGMVAGLSLAVAGLHALSAVGIWRREPWGVPLGVLSAVIAVPVLCGLPSIALGWALSRPGIPPVSPEPSPGGGEPG